MTAETKRNLIDAALVILNSDSFGRMGELADRVALGELRAAVEKAQLPHERDETDEKYFLAAQEHLRKDGELEFDEDAVVSISEEPGAYVQAWAWVEDEVAGVDRLIGRRFQSNQATVSEPFPPYTNDQCITLPAGAVFRVVSKDAMDNYRVEWEGVAELVDDVSGAQQTIAAAGAYNFFEEEQIKICMEEVEAEA